jgi:hypothetical protein
MAAITQFARARRLAAALPLLLVLAGCGGRQTAGANAQASSVPKHVFVANEKDRRFQFGRRIRFKATHQQFDQLEVMADSLQRTGECWPSGRPMIETFHENGFGEVDDAADPVQWEELLAGLREWYDARPDSRVAGVALAEALTARAWAARGHGWGSTVTPEQWQRFFRDLDEAGQLLSQIPVASRNNCEWHIAMMRVLHGSGGDADSSYWVVANDALTRFPFSLPLYTNCANHLLPRWYGIEGQWEKFADESTKQLPDSIADEFYARIVLAQSHMMANVFNESPGLSWERIEHGLATWRQRCPQSLQPENALAYLACLAGKHELAQRTFASMGDTFELEIWEEGKVYWSFRAWAEAPGEAKPSS